MDIEVPNINVVEELLESGLRVITVGIPNRATASMGIFVNLGSCNEINDIPKGISHFIEHLVFKGSAKYDQQSIGRIIEGKGGAYNAFTSSDCTCYYVSTILPNLWECADVLLDVVANPVFPEAEYAKERDVIIEEIRSMYDMPESFVSYKFDAHMWGGSQLGYSIAGEEEDLAAMTLADIKRVHNNYYRSNNMFVVIVGSLPADQAMKTFVDRYKKTFRVGAKPDRAMFDLDLYKRTKGMVSIHRNHQLNSWVQLGMLMPYESSLDAVATKRVFEVVLGGNSSSMLYQAMREELGAVYSIWSCYYTISNISAMVIGYNTDAAKEKACFACVKRIISGLPDNITELMVEDAKRYLLGDFLMSADSNKRIMLWIGNEIMRGRTTDLKQYVQAVNNVSLQDVCAISKKMCDFEKWKGVMIHGK